MTNLVVVLLNLLIMAVVIGIILTPIVWSIVQLINIVKLNKHWDELDSDDDELDF